MLDIPCVIFAGGKSSRMGEDKSLLPFAGFNTLTQFQLSRLRKIFKTVYISCKDKNKFDFTADFIEDMQSNSVYAPTIGFTTVFKTLQTESFFALSVDAPFVSLDEITKLVAFDESTVDATIAKTDFGIQPLCGIYHRSLESKFIEMQENNSHKLGMLLQSSSTKYLYFKDEVPFLNMNHPSDYTLALTLI
jgi:molybdopterin-guanine dinucleotide biosynthesis protein A